MKAINPATEEFIRDSSDRSAAEMGKRLRQADLAFSARRKIPFADRSGLMRREAHLLREGRAGHARLVAEEMGTPIAAAEVEIDKCAWNCKLYAEYAEAFLRAEEVRTEASRSFVRYDPLGP